MAILRLAVFAMMAGCFAPDSPACALACTADTDCVSGQHCTTDHWCAAEATTTCGASATSDGGNVVGTDAGSGSGSGMTTTLTIQVMGGGGVRTNDGAFCDGTGDGNQTCMFTVAMGEALTLTPIPHVLRQFNKWNGPPCKDQLFACAITATGPMVMAAAMFK